MNESILTADIVDVPSPPAVSSPAPTTSLGRRPRRIWKFVRGFLSLAIAAACLGGLAVFGQQIGWSLPKFSKVLGHVEPQKDDWCETHSVPDSLCVECRAECLPRGPERGWCKIHGVHECPMCHPDVAQLLSPPLVTDADRQRAEQALVFAPRVENNSKCKLQQRRIQVVSPDVVGRLGIEVTPAVQGPVTEFVTAPGEIRFDPTRVARLSSRVPGTVWRVEKQVGDKVRQGDVLAIVDSAEVGKSKSEFQQALAQVELRKQLLAGLKSSPGSVAHKNLQEAEAALEEANVRLLTAEQALLNLGLPVPSDVVRASAPAEIVRQMQFLGLPLKLVTEIANQTTSSNLIAVTAPLDGEVVERMIATGEAADPSKPMFVVAATSRLWLTLRVRLEDANRIQPGQEVRFTHAGHTGADNGTVTWISPAADEKSRSVQVRVELPNPKGVHHVNTYGSAKIILRIEPYATLIPSNAVHWEGDCNVVFVRDKNFEKSEGPWVFHVRKVRPGGQEMSPAGAKTEIIAGLLPGELVATTNSGIFRTELLKNNLGAG